MKAIGIDIGMKSISGIIINVETGDIEKTVSFNNESFARYLHPFRNIQEIRKILNTIDRIFECLPLKDVCAIGLTGHTQGILYIDKNGKHVSSLYTWQPDDGNQSYQNTPYAKYLGGFTGYGNATDFYNREHGEMPENAVTYCTIADYVAMRLCGLKEPYIHDSTAASLGNYNIETMTFDYDYNPKITNGYTIIGKYKGIPVAVAIGDTQASVLSTLTTDDDVLVNVGTKSQVSLISDTPIVSKGYEVLPYFENKYLVVGSTTSGGRVYAALKDFYKAIVQNFAKVSDDEIYSYMNKFPVNLQNSLTVDSRFAGTIIEHDLTGNISNITIENFTPQNLTTSILEAIAVEYSLLYDREAFGDNFGLVGVGNGIRKNPALVKYLEHQFEAIMKIPAHIQEAAYGAALYALISAGKFKNADEAHTIIKYSSEAKISSPTLKIGEKITSLRKLNGVTQMELAEMLSVSNRVVSKWETGLSYPDITVIPKLARIFNVTTDFLLDNDNT